MTWDLIGHRWAVDVLREHVAQGRIRHAYLLTGPLGVGRRTLALNLAQALDCPQPQSPGNPCQVCSTCKRIRDMAHPDLSVVQAEQLGGTLKVDQVRELQRSLSLTPYEARYRVALLLRFEEAHPSAANALLKTLEEPASQVVLILTAESAEALLPTIVSRCEALRLRPVPVKMIRDALQARWDVPAEQAQLLSHVCAGRPGYAVHLYLNPEDLEGRQECLDDFFRMFSASRQERFAFAEPLAKDKEKLRTVLAIWLTLWRDVLLACSGAASPRINPDCQPYITSLAGRLDLHTSQHMLTSTQRTLELLDKNVNSRLALEVLLLDMPHILSL